VAVFVNVPVIVTLKLLGSITSNHEDCKRSQTGMLLVTNTIHLIQGMIGRMTGAGICYGMEVKVKNTKIIRISMQLFPIQIMTDQKRLETVQYFNYLGSHIRNDARCTHEIKSRIAMAKAAFNMKKTLFTRKLDSNLR
jgi:hypothetical protein